MTLRLALVVSLALPSAASAGPLSALRNAREDTGAPAATAAVVQCGRVVWTGASGTLRDEAGPRARPTTRFVLASTTKTVVATLTMQLVQAGRLSLDQRVSDFYPSVPGSSRVTVRMLLNHTSGFPDYFDDSHLNALADNNPSHRWTRAEVIAGIRAPHFTPGSKYEYSNSNYILLGGIVEKLTNDGIENDFRRTIAGPAGMTRSTFAYRSVPQSTFARPYYDNGDDTYSAGWAPGVGIPSDYWGEVWTDGGLASTATDLARFGDALFAGRLVSAATLAQMTNVGSNNYGFAIYAKQYDGERWLGHDGSYGGYESEVWHDAADDVTVVVLTNLEEPDSADDTNSDVIWRAVTKAADQLVDDGCG